MPFHCGTSTLRKNLYFSTHIHTHAHALLLNWIYSVLQIEGLKFNGGQNQPQTTVLDVTWSGLKVV